jgi:hypothetical protein
MIKILTELVIEIKLYIFLMGMGTGDWGLGTGDWEINISPSAPLHPCSPAYSSAP